MYLDNSGCEFELFERTNERDHYKRLCEELTTTNEALVKEAKSGAEERERLLVENQKNWDLLNKVYSFTCVNHADIDRSLISCPVCLRKELHIATSKHDRLQKALEGVLKTTVRLSGEVPSIRKDIEDICRGALLP